MRLQESKVKVSVGKRVPCVNAKSLSQGEALFHTTTQEAQPVTIAVTVRSMKLFSSHGNRHEGHGAFLK